jgi:hypothetical protein
VNTSLEGWIGSRTQHGPRCAIGRALDELEPEASRLLGQALGHPEVMHTTIAQKMRELWGIRVSHATVGRHRRQGCSCG